MVLSGPVAHEGQAPARAVLLFDPFAGPGKFSAEGGDKPLIHEYLL
jgi:hypothetical protein